MPATKKKASTSASGGSRAIRVSESTHTILGWLSDDLGVSKQDVVEKAVEEYRRKMILKATNDAYAEIRKNPKAKAELESERAEWDTTLVDGIE